MFDLMKEQLKTQLENNEKGYAFVKLRRLLSKLLLGTYYLQSEQLGALETLGYEEYKQFQ